MSKISILLFLFTFVIRGGGLAPLYANTTPPTPQENWPSHLRILTGATDGQWDILGNAITEKLNDTLIPSSCRLGGAVANMEKIEHNLGELAFSMSCFLPTSDKKQQLSMRKNTVLLANIYPQVLYILLRKKFADRYKIENLESLLKKDIPVRFATLKKGTGSYFLFEMLLQYGYDYDFKQLQKKGWQISFNNYSEIADRFVNEELDGFAYTAGTEMPLILRVEQYIDITILPIAERALQPLHNNFHTNTYIIQPETYKSITRPITTLGTYASLVVRKDLPTDLVYSINKIIWENRKSIGKNMKNFTFFSPDIALSKGVATHPGSLKFWNELATQQ